VVSAVLRSFVIRNFITKGYLRCVFLDYTDLLKKSITSLSFSEELSDILDKYLDPALAKASFLPSSLGPNIKSAIVTAADVKVNEVKNVIVANIDGFATSCEARRELGEIVIDGLGQQRMLSADVSFKALSDLIESFYGVVSAVFGSDPSSLLPVLIFYFRRNQHLRDTLLTEEKSPSMLRSESKKSSTRLISLQRYHLRSTNLPLPSPCLAPPGRQMLLGCWPVLQLWWLSI
jgi:hypothetical protein